MEPRHRDKHLITQFLFYFGWQLRQIRRQSAWDPKKPGGWWWRKVIKFYHLLGPIIHWPIFTAQRRRQGSQSFPGTKHSICLCLFPSSINGHSCNRIEINIPLLALPLPAWLEVARRRLTGWPLWAMNEWKTRTAGHDLRTAINFNIKTVKFGLNVTGVLLSQMW